MPAIPSREHSPPDDPAIPSSESINVPLPLTRLEIRDLSCEGAKRFLQSVDPATILTDAIKSVHKILTPQREGTPNVRSITLILREFDGVAYTAGKDIDFEHKEIHFNTDYIENIKPELLESEITGVLVHEMVHVWQWNGQHQCNGGLIEGVADWVRLKAGLAPPHWTKRSEGCQWDAGYDVTGYFLEWLDETYGKGTVVNINQKLRAEYVEEEFWKELCGGEDVKALWARYGLSLASKDGNEGEQNGEKDGYEGKQNGEKEGDDGKQDGEKEGDEGKQDGEKEGYEGKQNGEKKTPVRKPKPEALRGIEKQVPLLE